MLTSSPGDEIKHLMSVFKSIFDLICSLGETLKDPRRGLLNLDGQLTCGINQVGENIYTQLTFGIIEIFTSRNTIPMTLTMLFKNSELLLNM